MSPVRVAIIGAGPAGLTLARILQHNNSNNYFEVAVYEKDSPTSRQQGGTLDLHPKAGLLALTQAGLIEQFRAHARPEGQDLKILDKNDKVHLDYVAEEGKVDHPEIDRTTLRNILLESLQPNTIQWGHKLLSFASTNDGAAYKLQFENGKETEVDVLVGAEGAWSKVRNFLTDIKPAYTGITIVETSIADVDKRHPDLAKYVGRGSVFLFSDGKSIQMQRLSTGSVRVYAGVSVPDTWIAKSGVQFDKPDAVRAALLEFFADWNSQALDFIRKCDEDFMIPRALYALPVSPKEEENREKEGRWPKHHDGVTLLGDSAHLTGPSGKGVNYAMLDALELAKALLKVQEETEKESKKETEKDKPTQQITQAIIEYQKGLFARSREAGTSAERIMQVKYAADAPVSFVELIKKAHS